MKRYYPEGHSKYIPFTKAAKKAWDALKEKKEGSVNSAPLDHIFYDTDSRVWVGISYPRMVSISYWPNIPKARIVL